MAKSLNRAQILGHLGQDPEIKATPQGSSVCNVSVATTESYKDKNSGEWKESTEWHKVVLWDYMAENAAKYLKKGSKVLFEGKIKTRSYEKDGVTRYITEIWANNMILLDRKEQSEGGYQGGYSGGGDSSYHQPDPAPAVDDDIPF